ncbi:MAG: aminotransferase class I/II-fold pyridoxal phosphate-dependent enzyme [Gemmatimonadales bacterium]|nr:MAG: aminotransferase class I/II-fold pyridoxal phosphate-dependent enzyme [Gemmatimonadales bacterium]
MAESSTHRLYLSPPHMGVRERELLLEAFDSNWIAPLGPQVDAFEAEFAERVGVPHALALSSGTAALHLALLEAGVTPGDEVIVSDLTFVASVNPVRYGGATPVLVGSEATSWNMDPNLLEDALRDRRQAGRQVAAVVVVHLYGQPADLDAITSVCDRYGVPLIEDAAEALGSVFRNGEGAELHPGGMGQSAIFSFNGNKIITTSGGGMLVSHNERLVSHARKLSTQARDAAPHYEHSEVGYNYRLSNLLAAVGRGQLQVLEDRVSARRRVFERYQDGLGHLPGLRFQSEAPWARHTRWLTCLTVDATAFGAGPEDIREALQARQIEARPLWKPMHLQPLYDACDLYGGAFGEALFRDGLCLPSGSSMTDEAQDRVLETILGLHRP